MINSVAMVVDLTPLVPHITYMGVAFIFSFWLSIALTPIYTTLAYRYKLWKRVRTDAITGEKAEVFHGLHAEKHKRNIPTMAGLVMVIVITLVTLTLNLDRAQTYLPLFAVIGGGVVGLMDDAINLWGKNYGIAGLRYYSKFLLTTLIAAAAGWYFYFKLGYSTLHVPFLGQEPIGWLLIPLFILVLVSTANAVNITDGLDGLSGGLLSIAFGTYGIIALLQGNFGIATFCFTVVGALLAYTWFNIYPARFFMGDVGSFALGTALGVVAMLTDAVLLLPIIGGMFVIEAGSSLLQIFSKKVFKRQIFRSAPIHHHFEAVGWPETKVTMRFWILGAVFGAFGVVIALLGGAV